MKTQEEIFRELSHSGLGGGFVAGNKLPKERGSLKEFKIIRIDAIEDENIDKLSGRLIEKLGEKPKRIIRSREEQLKALIKESYKKGKRFITIIRKAHLLHPRVLCSLKILHEFDIRKSIFPGFVLLGDIEKIKKLLAEEKGVEMRTHILSS